MKYAYKLAYFGKETYTDINSKPFITKHPKTFSAGKEKGKASITTVFEKSALDDVFYPKGHNHNTRRQPLPKEAFPAFASLLLQ